MIYLLRQHSETVETRVEDFLPVIYVGGCSRLNIGLPECKRFEKIMTKQEVSGNETL